MDNKYLEINEFEYPVYADLDDAKAYNNAIVGSTWADKDELIQKQYLVMATRKIDSYNYTGRKLEDEQPLKFPRISNSGKISDDNVLTQLCCQIATYYNDSGSGSGGGISGGGDSESFLNSVENYQIGDLHVKFKSDATLDLSSLDDFIEDMLEDWLMSQSMEIWL